MNNPEKKCPKCGFKTKNLRYTYCPECRENKILLIDNISDTADTSSELSDTFSLLKGSSASVGMGGINTGTISSTDNSNTTIINKNTIKEKTPAEILIENKKVYRSRCKELFHDGFITDNGRKELEELRCEINLDPTTAEAIRDEVKALTIRIRTELPQTGRIELENIHIAISQNNTEFIANKIQVLKGLMERIRSNELCSMYYQLNAILYPEKYLNAILSDYAEDYWKTYWSYIAFLSLQLDEKAAEALAELTAWDCYYPPQNQTLLLAIGYLMKNDTTYARNTYARLPAGTSNELTSIRTALSELLNTDFSSSNSIEPSGGTAFYAHHLFREFEKNIKELIQKNKEIIIEERIRQQKLQEQIESKKKDILKKFQETKQIEKACQEAGVAYHDFNTWLKEDNLFASSYNNLVKLIEEKKEKRNKKFKRILLFVLIIVIIGLVNFCRNLNTAIERENERTETENKRTEVSNNYNALKKEFNNNYSYIKNSPDDLKLLENACSIINKMREIEKDVLFSEEKESPTLTNRITTDLNRLMNKFTGMILTTPKKNDEFIINEGKNGLEKVMSLLNSIGFNTSTEGITYFESIKKSYAKGEYRDALEGFQYCKKEYSNQLNTSKIDEWINLCNSNIENKVAIEQQIKKQEEDNNKLKTRRENRLIYLSTEASIFNEKYNEILLALKDYINENSDLKFTSDPDKAYWCIYVTAEAKEKSATDNEGGKYYVSDVASNIKIKDMVANETICDNSITTTGTRKASGYKMSATDAYKKLKEEIGNIILKSIN